jgi:RHS repeat-associated protein
MYNANNQRTAKLINNQIEEKYLWLNLTTLLAVYDKDDNIKQRFTYIDERTPISYTDKNNNIYYLSYNHQGSLISITDTNAQTIKSIIYSTYGSIIEDTNPNINIPFGFAGGLYDKDTKLIKFGYRDYDSSIGRWITKDPIDFEGGDSNLYGYVLGDPVNFVDAEGLKLEYCKTDNGGIGYHSFWRTDNGSIGFFPAGSTASSGRLSGENGWARVPGTYLSPDPHSEDNDLICEEREGGVCIEKCLLAKKNYAPSYQLAFNNCRQEAGRLYNECKLKCSK